MTTDHMGSTCAHHYPHTKFHQCNHTELLSGYLMSLLLANQNRYANEVLNMRIRWRQTTWVVLVPPTTHIPSLTKFGHCIRERRFTFWCCRDLSSVHPWYRQCYNWKLSGPSSIAGGPQKKKKKKKCWPLFSNILVFQKRTNKHLFF